MNIIFTTFLCRIYGLDPRMSVFEHFPYSVTFHYYYTMLNYKRIANVM